MARVPSSGRVAKSGRVATSSRVTPPATETAPYLGRWDNIPYKDELARFRAARDNAANAPVDIFFWGNSLTMAYNGKQFGVPTGGYVSMVGDYLNSRLGIKHGTGWYPCLTGTGYSQWVGAANAGTFLPNERHGFGTFGGIILGNATLEITEECDRVELQYTTDPTVDVTNFRISIDGVEAAIVSRTDFAHVAGYGGNTWVSDALTYGTHTIKVESLNTSSGFGNLVVVGGIYFYKKNYSRGFRLWNGAHGGDSGTSLQTYPRNYDLAYGKQPDLAVYAHFHNDRGLSLTSFRNNVQAFIDNIKTNCPDTDILLMSEYQTMSWLSSHRNYDEMRQAMKDKAEENGVAYLDMGGFMGSLGLDGVSTDPEGLVNPDGTHQSNAGYQKNAAIVHAFLEDRKPPSRIQSPVDPSPTPTFNPLAMCQPLHVGWANDPDWVISDGAAVSSWPNRGSVGGNLVQATGTAQPVFDIDGINTRASVLFDGGDVLALDIADLTSYSAIVVLKPTSAAGSSRAMGFGAGSVASGIGFQVVSALGYWAHYRGTVRSESAPTVSTATPFIVASLSSTDLRVNNVIKSASSAGTNALNYLTVGAGSTGAASYGFYLTGHVAFWGVYEGDVSTHPDYGAFMLGLANFYGIT